MVADATASMAAYRGNGGNNHRNAIMVNSWRRINIDIIILCIKRKHIISYGIAGIYRGA